MASFTDEPVQFNPYIQQQPVELMGAAGRMRELQFQEGLNKAQSWIDNTLNLPIAKEETRQYVKSKVDQLGETLKTSISGDFSRQKVLNNVGGLIGQIANDPIVENGVRSTARITQAQSDITQAKKDGKWSQQNEDFFNKEVGRWLGDKDIETVFDGEYTPWVDYNKRFTDVYKELHAGQNIDDDSFRISGYDAEGNPQFDINPVLKEGISPERIKAAWNIVASQPDVQKQLQIDGWAKYKDMDSQSLLNNITENFNMSLKDIENTINTLNTKLAISSGADSEKISDQIEQLKRVALDNKNNASRTLDALSRDPEAAKSMLQEQNVSSSLVNAYSYEIMKKSPLWETSFEQDKFKTEIDHWNKDYEIKKENLKLKQLKALKGPSSDSLGDGNIILPAVVSENQRGGSASAYANKDRAQDEYEQSVRELVDAASGIDASPYRLENGRWILNVGSGPGQYKDAKSADEAAKVKYSSLRDAYINGNISDPVIRAKAESSQTKFDNLSNWENIIKESEDEVKPLIENVTISLGNINQRINYNGRDVNVTASDLVDVYSIKNNLNNKESARARLNQRFGNADDFISKNVDSSLSPSITGPSAIYNRPILAGIYSEVAGKLKKNKDLVTANQEVEKAFASRQTALQPNMITYGNDKESTEKNIQVFSALASRVADLTNSDKGPAQDILSVISKVDKESKDNLFQSKFDEEKGVGVISVRTKGESKPYTLEVPADIYFRVFPNQRVDNTFREKYGTRLSLGKGNTNYDNRGRAGGYQVNLPSNTPYTIQYHLKESGADKDGKLYEMYWWLTPKGEGKTSIFSGKVSSTVDGFPPQANQSQILEMVRNLGDTNFVNLLLSRKQKQDENSK